MANLRIFDEDESPHLLNAFQGSLELLSKGKMVRTICYSEQPHKLVTGGGSLTFSL